MRAGDKVRHRPSGETWVLASTTGESEVFPAGWPETRARAEDCELIAPCTDEEHESMLRKVALTRPTSGARSYYAYAALRALERARIGALQDVPERYREGLRRFVAEHIEPGGFLRAILEDRLKDALCRIDDDVTFDGLKALARFTWNEVMPGFCHGSPEAVAKWIALGEKCRAGETDCVHETWYESQPRRADGGEQHHEVEQAPAEEPPTATGGGA